MDLKPIAERFTFQKHVGAIDGMGELEMKKRILKTLEDTLMINREFMETKDIKDLEEQIEAVKCSIATETLSKDGINGNDDAVDLIGFVFCHGKDDYGFWEVVLPERERNQIMDILANYETWGCSIRGTAAELCEEFMSNEKGE